MTTGGARGAGKGHAPNITEKKLVVYNSIIHIRKI
jgi:hypothetical protein